ncbi:Flp pilus assembly protein CpaB [Pleomorphomonas carboxyditropha]|uniref:Flp pilus assembly protein CpaB n=1 Tax=Pleomorphomonas carboxyditropha TaxID=2023338 RepID=A0A2G9WUR4_9HYPH|nr:Flp pilus assembly protein CpaB [Pleomorphomonas carboxyditropha]PIO98437.1 Flp pilus assembly protein CpaB [Pleomorphomonas carboxyditropha]
MRPIQLVILLVAVGAAAGAGLIATRIGTRAPDTPRTVAAQPVAPPIDLEDVLVAAKDIGVGKTVDAENVSWKPWPKDGLSDGYIQRSAEPDAVTDLKSMLARSPILAGEPIRKAKLVRSDRGFLSAVLPEGMRAVAVRVNAASTAGGFILPEDRVDILLVRQKDAGEAVAETILTDIRVLAIDQSVQQTGDDKQPSIVAQNTATLELTPDQTELVTQAQQIGSISLALRPLVDNDQPAARQRKPTGVAVVKFGVVSRVTAQQAP